MSLAQLEKAQARELKQRRQLADDNEATRFILVKEGENWLGTSHGQPDLTHAYGLLGKMSVKL